jgi:hypothetical protein
MKGNMAFRAGVFVAVSVTKTSADTRLGLGLGTARDGKIVVTSIVDGTPAARTEIRVGMIVQKVNNIGCDRTKAAQMLKSAVGPVTLLLETRDNNGSTATPSLVASLATATVVKKEGCEAGITLANINGKLIISQVEENGLSGKSGLEPGMVLLSINNNDCSKKMAGDTMVMMKETGGLVTILAQKPFLSLGEVAAAVGTTLPSMMRRGKGAPLGSDDEDTECQATEPAEVDLGAEDDDVESQATEPTQADSVIGESGNYPEQQQQKKHHSFRVRNAVIGTNLCLLILTFWLAVEHDKKEKEIEDQDDVEDGASFFYFGASSFASIWGIFGATIHHFWIITMVMALFVVQLVISLAVVSADESWIELLALFCVYLFIIGLHSFFAWQIRSGKITVSKLSPCASPYYH